MPSRSPPPNSIDLRAALANIHRDPLWWRKVLAGGALSLTVLGAPWAAGLVVESIDNARKGYPTPLPPGGDWSARYIIGFLALLIDFVFFVLPALLLALLVGCLAVALALGREGQGLDLLVMVVAAALGLYLLLVFGLSIAPVGRLIYATEGRAEEAISARTIREALRPGLRAEYARARLVSLPAYLPALLLGLASWLVLRESLPGGLLGALLLIWLTFSALLYAHLVVAQLYAAIARAYRL